jgi:hypothetical protein
MRNRRRLWVVAAQIAVLAGCVPATLAPTVVVTPGPGKSAADFAADQTGCSALANQQMTPAIQAANNQLVGNALLGVTPNQTAQSAQSAQVTLQHQYDVAYSQCMYTKGDIVPGMTPVAAEPEPAPVTHRAKRYAKKKPTQQPTGSASAQPAPAAAATQSGSSFVEPAPAAPVTPASTSGGFAVPPPASH